MLPVFQRGNFPFRPKLFGDVGRNPGDAINRSRTIAKRKLHRKVLMGSVVMRRDLFTLQRFARFQHDFIVGSKCRGQFRNKNVEVGLAETLRPAHMK